MFLHSNGITARWFKYRLKYLLTSGQTFHTGSEAKKGQWSSQATEKECGTSIGRQHLYQESMPISSATLTQLRNHEKFDEVFIVEEDFHSFKNFCITMSPDFFSDYITSYVLK